MHYVYIYPSTRFEMEPRECACCEELLGSADLIRGDEGEYLPELCEGCRREGCNTEESCKNQQSEE